MELVTTRRYSFQSVHALHLGLHKERRHGHQYFLEVSFSNCPTEPVDTQVGRVLARLHGHELKGELEPATCEHLVEWIHARLLELRLSLRAVALQETRKNRFVSSASEARFV